MSPSPPANRPPPDLLARQVDASRYFFRPQNPPPKGGYAVAMGGREHCRPDYAVAREGFPFHVVEYVAEGNGVFRLDGQSYPLGAGSLLFYGPRTRCEIGTDGRRPMVKYFACLAGAGWARRAREAGLGNKGVLRLPAHQEIRMLFDQLIREGQDHHRFTDALVETAWEMILLKIATMLALGSSQDPARETFLRCKALVDAEAETLCSLGALGKKTGVSATLLCKLFRRYEDQSPYQYLLRRKMHLAAARLIETRALIKEIAASVGFGDPYHFSRCFKAVHGVAPRRFQETFSRTSVPSSEPGTPASAGAPRKK